MATAASVTPTRIPSPDIDPVLLAEGEKLLAENKLAMDECKKRLDENEKALVATEVLLKANEEKLKEAAEPKSARYEELNQALAEDAMNHVSQKANENESKIPSQNGEPKLSKAQKRREKKAQAPPPPPMPKPIPEETKKPQVTISSTPETQAPKYEDIEYPQYQMCLQEGKYHPLWCLQFQSHTRMSQKKLFEKYPFDATLLDALLGRTEPPAWAKPYQENGTSLWQFLVDQMGQPDVLTVVYERNPAIWGIAPTDIETLTKCYEEHMRGLMESPQRMMIHKGTGAVNNWINDSFDVCQAFASDAKPGHRQKLALVHLQRMDRMRPDLKKLDDDEFQQKYGIPKAAAKLDSAPPMVQNGYLHMRPTPDQWSSHVEFPGQPQMLPYSTLHTVMREFTPLFLRPRAQVPWEKHEVQRVPWDCYVVPLFFVEPSLFGKLGGCGGLCLMGGFTRNKIDPDAMVEIPLILESETDNLLSQFPLKWWSRASDIDEYELRVRLEGTINERKLRYSIKINGEPGVECVVTFPKSLFRRCLLTQVAEYADKNGLSLNDAIKFLAAKDTSNGSTENPRSDSNGRDTTSSEACPTSSLAGPPDSSALSKFPQTSTQDSCGSSDPSSKAVASSTLSTVAEAGNED